MLISIHVCIGRFMLHGIKSRERLILCYEDQCHIGKRSIQIMCGFFFSICIWKCNLHVIIILMVHLCFFFLSLLSEYVLRTSNAQLHVFKSIVKLNNLATTLVFKRRRLSTQDLCHEILHWSMCQTFHLELLRAKILG